MNLAALYRLLDHPLVYRGVESALAPGFKTGLKRLARDLTARYALREPFLDLGCGPASLLADLGIAPVGLDLSLRYARAFAAHAAPAVVGSAHQVPFAAGAFRTVWSLGLLHHLDVSLARSAIQEMVRVCAPAGDVVIIDAVLPRSAWTQPYAYLIRRLDRGGNVRSQAAHEELLPDRADWTVERHMCSLVGHEVTVCRFHRT